MLSLSCGVRISHPTTVLLLCHQVERKRDVDSLEAADHSSIDYSPFAKDFYEEAKDIAAMTDQQVMCMHPHDTT